MQASKTADQEDRREWRLLWLDSIQAFADRYTQETHWLTQPALDAPFSFAECMSSYFDEAYLGEEHAYQKRLKAGYVNAAEIEAVRRFHALVECYESPSGSDADMEAILKDPKWHAVVAAAADARQRLLTLVTDPSEREALSKPLYGRQHVDRFSDHESAGPVSSRGGFSATNLRHIWLILTKPVSSATAQTPAEVRRQLLPLGFHARKSEQGITYRIGYFTMGRLGPSDPTSRFAAFSQIRLGQERGSWVLRLKFNETMWLVLLITPAIVASQPIASVWIDLAIGLAVPAAMLIAAVLWARFRVTSWWRKL